MGEGLGVRYAQYASKWAGVNLICMCFPDRDEIDKERESVCVCVLVGDLIMVKDD